MGELQLTRRAALAALTAAARRRRRRRRRSRRRSASARSGSTSRRCTTMDQDDEAALGRGRAARLSQADFRQVSRAGRSQRRRSGGANRRRLARRAARPACRPSSWATTRATDRGRRPGARRARPAWSQSYPLYQRRSGPTASRIRRTRPTSAAAGPRRSPSVSPNGCRARWDCKSRCRMRGLARACASFCLGRARRVTRSTRSASPRRSARPMS